MKSFKEYINEAKDFKYNFSFDVQKEDIETLKKYKVSYDKKTETLSGKEEDVKRYLKEFWDEDINEGKKMTIELEFSYDDDEKELIKEFKGMKIALKFKGDGNDVKLYSATGDKEILKKYVIEDQMAGEDIETVKEWFPTLF